MLSPHLTDTQGPAIVLYHRVSERKTLVANLMVLMSATAS